MADEMVPQGITTKQDDIIQYVAKYVVSSCDSARYQEKIRTRTKYNSYFAFLETRHPYHRYYQYLLDSYRYHLQNSEAINANGWGGGDDAGFNQQQQQQQQQLTEEEYYQYYGAYQGQTGGIGFSTGDGEGTGYENGTSTDAQANEESAAAPPLVGAASGSADGTAPSGDATVTGVAGADGQDGSGDAKAEAEDEEDDEEEYELVMENGEWVSRKRS